MPRGSAPGERRGGRGKGAVNKPKAERNRDAVTDLAHVASLVPNLTFDQAMNLRAIDVMRTAQAMYAMAGEWAKASAWAKEIAPYETAKLAPKPEEAATETDEERAYRAQLAHPVESPVPRTQIAEVYAHAGALVNSSRIRVAARKWPRA